MKVGFIGLGKLGLPVAETMAERYQVIGYDTAEVKANLVKITNDILDTVKDTDITFVAVPTPHDVRYDGSHPTSHLENKDFDYGSVIDVFRRINGHVNPNGIMVLISTVLPGTIRKQLASELSNVELIYNPYLIAMGTVAYDFANPEMVMIGSENGMYDDKILRLVRFYESLMSISPRIVVGTWEEMECTKLFYNTFISTKLCLVNMMQDVAERVGFVNVDVVANALAGSTNRITGPAYMKPGMGDGGPCHPRDNIALRYLAERLDIGYDLFDGITKAREMQAENLAKELIRHRLPVIILGKSFKPGVPYTDGSYSVLVGHYVEEMGGVLSYDHVSDEPATYLLGHNVLYDGYEFATGSVIVDPWRNYRNRDGLTVINYGDTRTIGPRHG